ncbi:PfkB family carbohydrate kinase, partial [Halorubrum ejinorense]
ERARAAGCRVLFDPNVRPELWEVDPAPTMRRMLSMTDVLKGSPWGRGEWHHGGYRVDDVADTTGAGDAFTAGVVAGLVDGTA